MDFNKLFYTVIPKKKTEEIHTDEAPMLWNL